MRLHYLPSLIFLLLTTFCLGQAEVKIGAQTWSEQNLNVTTFNNGEAIPQAQTKEEWVKAAKNKTPAWCYYKNEKENGDKYGILYNWYAVTDSRGIAPSGWRVPTKKDAEALIGFLGKNGASKMKSKDGWSGTKTNSNSSGFNAKAAGMRNFNGRFQDQTFSASWWTSTPVEPAYLNSATNFHVKHNNDEIKSAGIAKNCGLHVRLIKN